MIQKCSQYGGSRFCRAQIRLNTYLTCTHMHSPTFLCCDIALVTYITPGRNFLKTHTHMHFYLKLANNNHIGIFDVFVTETMLVTTENSGPLPLQSQIRSNLGLAESWTTSPVYHLQFLQYFTNGCSYRSGPARQRGRYQLELQ